MPRTRGAAGTRSEGRRHRGDHDNETTKRATGERRVADHASAEPTADSLQLFINQAMRYPLLTAADEIELAKRIERGDLAAKERLVNSNLRLVLKFARRYQGHGLDLGDLVQEAMLGLIRAAEKFDWRRGYKFSTYAVLWIKQSIQRGLDNSGRQVRIPAHVAQRERTAKRVADELASRLDRDPTDEEVAKAAKLPVKQVREVRGAARAVASLDKPVGESDSAAFGDLFASDEKTPDEQVEVELTEKALRKAVGELSEREQRILSLRYGLNGQEEPKSLEEIGRILGITRERVRQLESEALRRLAERREIASLRSAA